MSWLTIMFLLMVSVYLMRIANAFDAAAREEARERRQLARWAAEEDAAFREWMAAETARLKQQIDAIVEPFEEWEAQERAKTIDLRAIDLDRLERDIRR